MGHIGNDMHARQYDVEIVISALQENCCMFYFLCLQIWFLRMLESAVHVVQMLFLNPASSNKNIKTDADASNLFLITWHYDHHRRLNSA